jgi:glutathionylspermidine synthase
VCKRVYGRVFILLEFEYIAPIEKKKLEELECFWHTDISGEDYILRDRLLCVSKAEAQAFYKAGVEIYSMYEKAAEYVIKNNLFAQLDIDEKLIPLIKHSFKYDRDKHLYGRFDLSGGIDNKDIKLIEFNADTPTMLLESSIVQAVMVQDSRYKKQFNFISDAILAKLKSISLKGEFSRFLFSSVDGINEEIYTTKVLQKIADISGVVTGFEYFDEIYIDNTKIVDRYENSYDFWFKLYPWEEIVLSNTEFLDELLKDIKNLQTSIINPAYTLLYQSKGMLKILYDLFEDSPYLLKTSDKPLDKKYVKKHMFGREGANIEILTPKGEVLNTTDGAYGEYKSIYQEYTEFAKDEDGRFFQAGLFFSDEPCGLAFRVGGEILDDTSKFMGHCIKN